MLLPPRLAAAAPVLLWRHASRALEPAAASPSASMVICQPPPEHTATTVQDARAKDAVRLILTAWKRLCAAVSPDDAAAPRRRRPNLVCQVGGRAHLCWHIFGRGLPGALQVRGLFRAGACRAHRVPRVDALVFILPGAVNCAWCSLAGAVF